MNSVAEPARESVRAFFAFFAIYIVYGSMYLGISVTVRHHVPPLSGSGFRYVLAGGALLLFLRARGRSIRIGFTPCLAVVFSGVLLLSAFGLVSIAQKQVSSGLAAVLLATIPLLVLSLRVLVDRERPHPLALLGVVLGFAGTAMILLRGDAVHASPGATVLVLVAAVAVALGSFVAPRLPLPVDTLTSAAWQMLYAGLVLIAAGVAAGEVGGFEGDRVSASAYVAFVYLVVAAAIAFTSYVWLLERYPVSRVAAFAYVNPLVAVVLGWAILHEALDASTLAGGALILLSVAMTVSFDTPRLSDASGAAD